MADEQHQIVSILVKYALRQPLNEQETRVLEEWRSKSEAHDALPEQFRDRRWVEKQHKQLHTPPTEEMWADIRQYIDEEREAAPVYVLPARRGIGYGWVSIAAVLALVVIGGGIKWYLSPPARERVSQATGLPASYKALLTLDDGSMVVLDTLARGAMLVEGGLRFRKTDSNSFVYSTDARIDPSIRHRLTIAPGAGVYRIQWADGSKAWLKAGTTVDYAVDIRCAEMQLAGEAWFRVAHDPSRPITIGTPGGVKTRVLGTSFDIRSAAGGSENRVALFSGRVRVVKGGDSVLLKPGSQAVTGGKGVEVKPLVDSNAELAWLRPVVKTSYFDLNDADLLTLLPEIARWYRVQVVNRLGLRGVGITGEFAHTTPLADLIGSLNRVEGIHVRIYLQDDTLFVKPLKRGP